MALQDHSSCSWRLVAYPEFVTRRDWHFGKTEIARQHEGVVTDNPTLQASRRKRLNSKGSWFSSKRSEALTRPIFINWR